MERYKLIKKEDLSDGNISKMMMQIREANEGLFYNLRHDYLADPDESLRLDVLEYLRNHSKTVDMSDFGFANVLIELCRKQVDTKYFDFLLQLSTEIDSVNSSYYYTTFDEAVERNISIEAIRDCYEKYGSDYYEFGEELGKLEPDVVKDEMQDLTSSADAKTDEQNPEIATDVNNADNESEAKVKSADNSSDTDSPIFTDDKIETTDSAMEESEEPSSTEGMDMFDANEENSLTYSSQKEHNIPMENNETSDFIEVLDELRESNDFDREDSGAYLDDFDSLINDVHKSELELIKKLRSNHNKDCEIIRRNTSMINCQRKWIEKMEQRNNHLLRKINALEMELDKYRRSKENSRLLQEKFKEMKILIENNNSLALPDHQA